MSSGSDYSSSLDICAARGCLAVAAWWSQTGSNRRPPACKAGALPTELWPLVRPRGCSTLRPPFQADDLAKDPATKELVGLERFELSTSRLSSARSNQLSYRPGKRGGCPNEERETKAAVSRKRARSWRFIGPHVFLSTGKEVKPRWFQLVLPGILRKEVIQPQVPLRLPCYDFTPVADLTVAGCLLAVSAPSSGKTNSHGVTGGVYKARERIHRGVLIRDY